MPKNKFVSSQDKLKAVEEYLAGNGSYHSISQKYGVTSTPFRKWIAKYKAFGNQAFIKTKNTIRYTKEFKETVARAYINGEGSLQDIAIRFKIPTQDTVKQWVLKYNGHEELKASKIGGNPIMTNGRKTTYDERIEIIKYCIEHQNNYAETALKYEVSYQQVYTWCNKYETNGVEALQDKRGRKKPENEMSEVEKLRAENKLLRAENRRKDLENVFLKKLEEIERRRH